MTSSVTGVYGRGIYVDEKENTIFFDNDDMNLKVEEKVIEQLKSKMFNRIGVGYKKMYLGTILDDIANNFQAPKILDLDLFNPHEDLQENEASVRKIFSNWKDKEVEVLFRLNKTVLRTFKL